MAVTKPADQAAGQTEDLRVTRRSAVAGYAPVAITAVVLALVPVALGGDGFFVSLAILGLVYAGYAIAFNVIFGGTNQLFLCMGALAGLAGYTSGIVSNDFDLPLVLTMPLGILAASLLGGLFSLVAVRRRLDVIFIGIVTLAFSLAFTTTVQATRDLTGGETGLVIAAGGGTPLRSRLTAYYLFLALVVAFLVIYRLIQRSHLGWAFRALRDDETAAELAGIDVARYKVIAGLIGSAMLGAVGVLWAHHEGFISPQTYAFAHIDVRIIVMLAFGGIGTLLGPIVGAATFAVVDEVLRPLGQMRMAIYGVVLVTLFLGFRSGVVPAVVGAANRIRRRPADRSAPLP
jgi:branched-chain amino acid transport system permease protein